MKPPSLVHEQRVVVSETHAHHLDTRREHHDGWHSQLKLVCLATAPEQVEFALADQRALLLASNRQLIDASWSCTIGRPRGANRGEADLRPRDGGIGRKSAQGWRPPS
eukprot:scaffold31041_cov69-Phaeocystis_antarctica.AAC.3